uniref:Uncharacterized protein n=1 Tax=Setaria italica TaxID=4555 RepID=K4A4A3_SETIT
MMHHLKHDLFSHILLKLDCILSNDLCAWNNCSPCTTTL